MDAAAVALVVLQLVLLAVLRYVAKRWIFNLGKQREDAVAYARTNPIVIASEYKREIQREADLLELAERETRKFILRQKLELLIVWGAHAAFLGMIGLSFFVFPRPWLFLGASAVLFWLFVVRARPSKS